MLSCCKAACACTVEFGDNFLLPVPHSHASCDGLCISSMLLGLGAHLCGSNDVAAVVAVAAAVLTGTGTCLLIGKMV